MRWGVVVKKAGGKKKIKSDKRGVMSCELGAPSPLCCRPRAGVRAAAVPLRLLGGGVVGEKNYCV